jgi:hypothetical protein
MTEQNSTDKVEKHVSNMSREQKDEILEGFNSFKDYLGDKVSKGRKLGLSDEALAIGAKKVAEYLSNHEEPKNREQKLLNELWEVSDEEEKKHLSKVLVKLTETTN